MENKMLKNVVFDIGNVLIEYKPQEFLRMRYGEDPSVGDLYKSVFCGPEWVELDRGTVLLSEAAGSISRKSTLPYDKVLDALCNWVAYAKEMTETTTLIPALIEKGLRIYYLSNFHSAASRYVFEKFAFFRGFDGGVFSCDCKLLKPDSAIYEKLAGQYGLIPDETLFIDDTPQNARAAEALGWNALVFSGAGELAKKLNTFRYKDGL